MLFRSGIAARSKEVLAGGRDLYLMFKHEESPEGALHAETVLEQAGRGVDGLLSDAN